jgi:hypothetical protein
MAKSVVWKRVRFIIVGVKKRLAEFSVKTEGAAKGLRDVASSSAKPGSLDYERLR